MKFLKCCLWAAGVAFSATGALAQVTVSGIKFDESNDVRSSKLQLNGAGVRYKTVFKVYAAGLYLPRKASTTEEVLTMPGAKRMSITMLREIDSTEFGKLVLRGVEDNMDKASFSRLIPGLQKMSQLFFDCKKLGAGDTISIDWIPGTGTIIGISNPRCSRDGEPQKEPEFYSALLRIWLGPSPADWRLKEALLGKAP